MGGKQPKLEDFLPKIAKMVKLTNFLLISLAIAHPKVLRTKMMTAYHTESGPALDNQSGYWYHAPANDDFLSLILIAMFRNENLESYMLDRPQQIRTQAEQIRKFFKHNEMPFVKV